MQFHVVCLLTVFVVSSYLPNDVNAYAAKHKKNVLALKNSAALIRHHQQKHRQDRKTSSVGFSNAVSLGAHKLRLSDKTVRKSNKLINQKFVMKSKHPVKKYLFQKTPSSSVVNKIMRLHVNSKKTSSLKRKRGKSKNITPNIFHTLQKPKISFPRHGRKRVSLGTSVHLNPKQKISPAITKVGKYLSNSSKNKAVMKNKIISNNFRKLLPGMKIGIMSRIPQNRNGKSVKVVSNKLQPSKLNGSMKNRQTSESISKRQSFANSKKKTPLVSARIRTSVNPRLKTFLPLFREQQRTKSQKRVTPISKSAQRKKMTEVQLLTSIKPSYQNVLNLIGPGCSINDVS